MNAEEVLFGGRGHGERVPLQLRDGRAVEEDVLTHLHLETVLHHLQLQHFGRPHHDLIVERAALQRAEEVTVTSSARGQTHLPVSDRLHVANESDQPFTEVQNHRTDDPHPRLGIRVSEFIRWVRLQ